jgi:aspartate aminotransferase-like enzyme
MLLCITCDLQLEVCLSTAAWCALVAVQVNGKVFRIGHLGNMDELMMCSAISGAEMAMLDAGRWTGSRL